MNDPFLLPPRSVISFSGGRTSGYMLRRVLDAFGGRLPKDRVVLFANTGKEREETLDFVEECSTNWGVPITWLEYRYEPLPVRVSKQGKPVALDQRSHGFAVVTYATASRNGEPFAQAIQARCDFRAAKGDPGVLPHVRGRYCTAELKIRTKGRYVKQRLTWGEYYNAIGMRADEPRRVALLTDCDYVEDASCRGEKPLCPLAEAGVGEQEVMEFWSRQSFDLRLRQDQGNCDLCYLKKFSKIERLVRERPEAAAWWAEQEAKTGDVFRRGRPRYAELPLLSSRQTTVFDDPEEQDCHCTD